jgi:hypothetical protein
VPRSLGNVALEAMVVCKGKLSPELFGYSSVCVGMPMVLTTQLSLQIAVLGPSGPAICHLHILDRLNTYISHEASRHFCFTSELTYTELVFRLQSILVSSHRLSHGSIMFSSVRTSEPRSAGSSGAPEKCVEIRGLGPIMQKRDRL